MPRILPIVLLLAVWIYGLVDCIQTPDDRVPRGLPKTVWIVLVAIVPGIGALVWLALKYLASRGGGSVRRNRGPMAPDDDPEFLANLDWQARKAHYERLKRQKEEEERRRREAEGTDETSLEEH